MSLSSVKFEELLAFISQLPPEQKQVIRQRLNEEWAARFGQVLAEVHAQMPDVSDDELAADIEQAISETRRNQT